ncbi:xanthine dehydrogenase family protein subunit M [Castellaniella sp. GW247-6E4]|uniref:FAD binding domain-containing protein n=1 Tax=Castellaniella sp. GW247-6E4 TaxID=3140380 RepID=UPI0033146933
MKFFRPASLPEALNIKSEFPDCVPIAGGTDLMVMINFDRRRPPALLDLSGVPELRTIVERPDGVLRIGAGVSCKRLHGDYADALPSLAMAAGTVGSPQIRNRATVGGNIATSSPAGDTLPPLIAAGAVVELASVGGSRRLPLEEFLIGPKRNALRPDELIEAVHVRRQAGPQLFSKVGTRNAMVISISSLALDLRPAQRAIRCAIGSAAPKVLLVEGMEALGAALPWPTDGGPPGALDDALVEAFSGLVSRACSPIDDMRGSARYRRRSLEALARRNLTWAWRALERRSTCV